MIEYAQEWGALKLILGPNKGKYPYCHSLFWDGKVKVLIDPASDPNTLKKIADEKNVDAILLSHYHEDHFMSMYMFPRAKLYVHSLDAPPLADLETLMKYYGMEQGSEERIQYEKLLIDLFHYVPRKADVELTDGQKLDFGDLHITVLHTPGHSPGHLCFHLVEPNVLFLADFDLTKFGPWYGDKLSDLDNFIGSAEKMRRHPARWKVVAHEEPVFEGDIDELWEKYLAVVDRRESDLLGFLSEPRTIQEIVAKHIVYGKPREPAGFFEFGERGIMTKHIERLIKRGVIGQKDDRYFRSRPQ